MNLLNTVLGDYWVAEYSDKQKSFNVDTVRRISKTNAMLVQNRENTGYLIFGLYKTIDEANAACDEMRQAQERAVNADV